MENYNKIDEAKKLYLNNRHGILSTLSTEKGLEGYPFGSLTPYSIDSNGEAVILISDIAEHTRNITQDNRVSLTIVEAQSGEVHAQGRMTYLAKALRLNNEEANSVYDGYIKRFPEAKNYFKAHHFVFHRLKFIRARFIGGFGKVFWIEPDEFLD